MHRSLRSAICFTLFAASLSASGQKWTQPTPEELKMTTDPAAPGVSAVFLYIEQPAATPGFSGLESALETVDLSDNNALRSDDVASEAACDGFGAEKADCLGSGGRIAHPRGDAVGCHTVPRISHMTRDNVASLAEEAESRECILPMAQVARAQLVETHQEGPIPFDASERVKVLVREAPAQLLEPVEIPIEVSFPGPAYVQVSQSQTVGPQGFTAQRTVDGSYERQPVESRGGKTFVTVLPRRLGKVEVELSGRFADGGYFKKSLTLDVTPPSRQPTAISIGESGLPDREVMRLLIVTHPDKPGRQRLNINAEYKGESDPVVIDPSFASFRVVYDSDGPAFNLDEKTGAISAVRPGAGLIYTSFAGHTNITCVAVTNYAVNGQTFPNAECQKLLRPGEHLGPLQ